MISSIEGKLSFCPVESRILFVWRFCTGLFAVANRGFFLVIPSDFDDDDDDGPDRLLLFIPIGVAVGIVILFGDNGRGISSFTLDDRTVNDDELGRPVETVLLIITRVGGFDTTEYTGGAVAFDEDKRISEMEFVRS